MKRFYLMPFVLAASLGSVFVLPQRTHTAATSLSSAVDIENQTPPLHFGEWSGIPDNPSEQEKRILANDTKFIKGTYTSYDLPILRTATGQAVDGFINLSIVISGNDINNSIHRPERCLRAQGHIGLTSLPDDIKTPAGHNIKTQHIHTEFPLPPAKEGDAPFNIGFVSYYYFVGHQHITHSHWTRIYTDMVDRLRFGTDQQWSFIMVSMPYNLGDSSALAQKNHDFADKKIRQFLGELTDQVVDWKEIK